MKDFFQRLRARHYTWALVLFVVGIAWPVYVISTPPDFLQENVEPIILYLCMWVSLIGSIVKIFGFLSSQQPGTMGVLGVSIELVGLILASIGPVAYILSYIVTSVTSGSLTLSSAPFLVVGVCLIYLHRAVVIVPRFRREAHDLTKE